MRTRRGFSLIDLLVSVAVIGALIAVLLPALSAARAAANRVACASNVKQLGIGLGSYAFDWDGFLPTSLVGFEGVGRDDPRPQDSLILRFDDPSLAIKQPQRARIRAQWDGLGLLYSDERLTAPGVFYCPAHTGDHPRERYEDTFGSPRGEIVGNYQYRHEASGYRLASIDSFVALVSNAIRSQPEYSHKTGHNVARADLSVEWFDDSSQNLYNHIPATGRESNAGMIIEALWHVVDDGTFAPDAPDHGGGGGGGGGSGGGNAIPNFPGPNRHWTPNDAFRR